MVRRLLAGVLGGAACLLFASLSRAECRMDNDCPGDFVCENAACVPPSSVPAPAPAPAPPAAHAPVARAQPTTAPLPHQARVQWQAEESPVETPVRPIRGKRHSTAMFVSGIVITSLAPIGLMVASLGTLCGLGEGSNDCGDIIVGGLVATGILAGVGVPLIVIGAQRDPVAVGRVAPWLTPHSAGVGLHFDL